MKYFLFLIVQMGLLSIIILPIVCAIAYFTSWNWRLILDILMGLSFLLSSFNFYINRKAFDE